MLTEIHIRNFALIDNLSLHLGSGFNVLTGETGAGKSIIIDAITMVLGERVSSDSIRTGADKALVEAVFDLSDDLPSRDKIGELGIDAEDGLLILSRELATGGKSQSRINGRASTASMIRDLTSGLIDIHGQHEHQSLLATDHHIDILDQWCGDPALDLRLRIEQLYAKVRSLNSELEKLKSDERERARLQDLYEFQRNEIEAANLSLGEDEELLSERNRLANAEKLSDLATAVYDAISGAGSEGGATDLLSNALTQLQSMAALDDSLASALQDLETSLYAAEQVQSAMRAYREEVEANPARLEAVEDRLDLIRTLKRKFGDDIETVLAYGKEVAGKIDDLAHSEERTAEIAGELEQTREALLEVSMKLSGVRKASATKFAKAVESELSDLAMSSTEFGVAFLESAPGQKGIDQVEFVISPNPGEPLKPLARIASGGELSRIMLALKTVMAGADKVPTLIFDEIDTGIGGRTAQVLGMKLGDVARSAQVICVTHLPQIASRADHQFFVEKHTEGDRTVVRISPVEGEARVDELARMLGGSEGSQTAVEHAREMLKAANR